MFADGTQHHWIHNPPISALHTVLYVRRCSEMLYHKCITALRCATVQLGAFACFKPQSSLLLLTADFRHFSATDYNQATFCTDQVILKCLVLKFVLFQFSYLMQATKLTEQLQRHHIFIVNTFTNGLIAYLRPLYSWHIRKKHVSFCLQIYKCVWICQETLSASQIMRIWWWAFQALSVSDTRLVCLTN